MSSTTSFEAAIEASRRALDEIARGNLDPFIDLYSDRDDATLGNPYGHPPAVGTRSSRPDGEPQPTTATGGRSSSRTSRRT
jgi:hypothetical protein